MANKSIKKEAKKPKKSDKKMEDTVVFSAPRPIVTQPELIKKAKKPK